MSIYISSPNSPKTPCQCQFPRGEYQCCGKETKKMKDSNRPDMVGVTVHSARIIGVVENVRPHQDTATAASLSLLLGYGGLLVGRLRSIAVATSVAWPHGLTPAARRVSSLVLYVLGAILLVVSLGGWR